MTSLDKSSLETPETFDFPFPPYNIQLQFMKQLYNTLESKKFGIFESPTGTGKSLSIICGAIKWLKDHNEFQKELLMNEMVKLETEKARIIDEIDWLTSQTKEIEINKKLNELKMTWTEIKNYEKKIQDMNSCKDLKIKKELIASKKLKVEDIGDSDAEDEDLLVEDTDIVSNSDMSDEESSDETYEPIKIYICSRTHSQLSQFIGEIMKSPFSENVRVTTLASRQTYCINPKVRNLKSVALINERCLDLQKKTCNSTKVDENGKVTKKKMTDSACCTYYKPSAMEALRNEALMHVQDVEDLVKAGRELNACPYYASRKAAADAEVIFVPYNTLLHKATRDANGIKLKNNVVIIDEAHNLMESLAQMHSTELCFTQIYHSLIQLKAYKNKFNSRFSAKNLLVINQLIFVVSQLELFMSKRFKENTTEIFTLENFVLSAQIDNFNMFKIVKFSKEARLAQKIRTYAMKYPVDDVPIPQKPKGISDFLNKIKAEKSGQSQNEITEQKKHNNEKVPQASNPMLAVITFLESLTYSYEDGRILFKGNAEKYACKFQFLLLNSSSQFTDIVKQARSVIVAGGTMKPIAEFRNRLFINSGTDANRIIEFACDHIIPPENILPIIVTKGPQNENLLFNFENRMKMGSNLKNIILQTCQTVTGGIVVFFPSYNYENWVWQQMKDMNFGRDVFREPHNSGSVEEVLEKYAKAIKKSNSVGAILFSVVGGKLSEGLNFSDDLGRCVIVVGLPYANIKSPELKEKMTYLDKTEGLGSAQKFYENICLKAVNQCIGRAVRHKNDYASVLLLDERYNRISVKNALPNWIKKSLRICNYEETYINIRKFFENKADIKKI